MNDGGKAIAPRILRLYADFIRLTKIAEKNQSFVIRRVIGNPPEEYEIEYRVVGLREKNGEVVEAKEHRVGVKLPAGYPGEAPLCQMLTSVFHPNISKGIICVADIWAAGESLPELVIRIGQMICYQRYNVKSPRDGEAARWASENLGRLPLDQADLVPSMLPGEIGVEAADIERLVRQGAGREAGGAAVTAPPEGSAGPAVEDQPAAGAAEAPALAACGNCGRRVEEHALIRCAGGHLVCDECLVPCPDCDSTNCVMCAMQRCAVCEALVCPRCSVRCGTCGRVVCASHAIKCASCEAVLCPACRLQCRQCQDHFCNEHLRPDMSLCAACAASQSGKIRITIEEFLTDEDELKPAQAGVRTCGKCGQQILRSADRYCTMCGAAVMDGIGS